MSISMFYNQVIQALSRKGPPFSIPASAMPSNNLSQPSSKIPDLNAVKKLSSDLIKLIEVITEISEAVNLATLQAAIEAARAGNFGKNFAIIAKDLQSLSERCTMATRLVADIIEKAQKESAREVVYLHEIERILKDIKNAIEVYPERETLASQISKLWHEFSGLKEASLNVALCLGQ